MKLLKKILLGLLALIALLLIIVYLMPRKVNISVSAPIEAPANYAYNLVNDMRNNDAWDPWLAEDKTMVMKYTDKYEGVGSGSSWEGQKSGSGVYTVTEVVPNEKIVGQITFDGTNNADVSYRFKDKGAVSEMEWNMSFENSFPMNAMNIFMKSGIKKTFLKGIENVSKLCKERLDKGLYGNHQVTTQIIMDKNYVTNRSEVPIDKIQQFYVQNLAPLFQKIQQAGVTMDGKPSGLFYSYNEKTGVTDMAAGIPINQSVSIAGTNSETIIAGKAAIVEYMGDFTKTESAHNAIAAFMRDRGLFPRYPIIEEYVTDPSEEKDPNKWLTRIIYPLAD